MDHSGSDKDRYAAIGLEQCKFNQLPHTDGAIERYI